MQKFSQKISDKPPEKKERIAVAKEQSGIDDAVLFDSKAAKEFLGQRIYKTLKSFVEKDFDKWFNHLNDAHKIAVIHNFMDKYFPKEIKIEQEDPFAEWTYEELKNFHDNGIKPKGKVIFLG